MACINKLASIHTFVLLNSVSSLVDVRAEKFSCTLTSAVLVSIVFLNYMFCLQDFSHGNSNYFFKIFKIQN